MTFHLYGKNISIKGLSAFRIITLPVMYGNLSIVLIVPRRCFAHRQRITLNTAIIMSSFAMGQVMLQFTSMIEWKEAFSWILHFLNHPALQQLMISFSFSLFLSDYYFLFNFQFLSFIKLIFNFYNSL